MPAGYSLQAKSGRKLAGYGVACDAHLALADDSDGRQDKVPYATEAQARSRLDFIEQVGLCRGEHKIVAVWAISPNR